MTILSVLILIISISTVLVIIWLLRSVLISAIERGGTGKIIISKKEDSNWTIISKYCSPINEDKLLFRVYLSDINISSGLIYIDPYRMIDKNKTIVILVKKEDIKRVEEEKTLGDLLFIKVVLKNRNSIIESDTLKQWRGYYEEK